MRSRKLQAVPSANWRPRKASAVSSMSKAGEEECSSSSNQAESKSGSERVRENERDRKNKFPFLPPLSSLRALIGLGHLLSSLTGSDVAVTLKYHHRHSKK